MRNPDGFDVATRERLHDILEPRLADRTDQAITRLEMFVFLSLAIPVPKPGEHGRKKAALVKARKALHDLDEALLSEHAEPFSEVILYMAANGAFGPIPSSDELAVGVLLSEELPAFMRGQSIDEVAHDLDANPNPSTRLWVALGQMGQRNNGRTPLDAMLENLRLTLDVLTEVDGKDGRPINFRDKLITGVVADELARFGVEPERSRGATESTFERVLDKVLTDVYFKTDDVVAPDDLDRLVRWAVDVRKKATKQA